MKSPSLLIVISLIAGLFLAGLVISGIISQEKTKKIMAVPLYEFAPIERVNFSAIGKVVEIDKEKITIERLGETLSMDLAAEVRVMIFSIPKIEENIPVEPKLVEPESGKLEDVQVGVEVNVFGVQRKDGSLVIEMITIQR